MFVDIFNDLLSENYLTKKRFSEQSGIPYPTIVGWTKLNRLPDYTALIKIADFFHCSVDYLMERQEGDNRAEQVNSALSNERLLISHYRKLSADDKELISKLAKKLSEI